MENSAAEQRPKEIYKAILGITQDLIKEGGIGKNRINDQQKFKFRGIEDIQNALAPLLVKHQVCIVPTFANRKSEQYDSKSGGKLLIRLWRGSSTSSPRSADPMFGSRFGARQWSRRTNRRTRQ